MLYQIIIVASVLFAFAAGVFAAWTRPSTRKPKFSFHYVCLHPECEFETWTYDIDTLKLIVDDHQQHHGTPWLSYIL